MELSLFYFAFILLTLLSTADPNQADSQCPTSRRLLLFGGLNLPIGEKKSHHSSSSSRLSSSSPPKYARSGDSRGLTVFIRPQTSNELGHKVRSYTHLLKSKLYTDEEKAKRKNLKMEKKKQLKKKHSTQHEPPIITKTQELVPINPDELNHCRALLHIDSVTKEDKKSKKSKKDKSVKQTISSAIKNATSQVAKNFQKKTPPTTTTTTKLPINDKKQKIVKENSKTNSNEKKIIDKSNENRPRTSPVNNISPKAPLSSPPPLQSPINTKSKRTKPETITIIQETTQPFNTNEDEIEDKNNSVVDRAYHFVKNMFQLSDDLLEEDQTQEDQVIDITSEQQQKHHHTSRKLLSIDDEDNDISRIIDDNNTEVNSYLNNEQSIETNDDLSFLFTSISKRQLLSVKTNKHSLPSKIDKVKDKKVKSPANADANKPKVGWAYRYRISRYLAAQKMKRNGNKNKPTGGGKTKQTQKQNLKKIASSSNTKFSKRKLLEYNDDSSCFKDKISDQDIVNSVLITEHFIPKRQLLASKIKDNDDDDEDDEDNEVDQKTTRRQKKSLEELTDPVAIVDSYEKGLFKPRVGWQFRYRVSRYIDSLRANIREDQERLKLGLQAIKRKTPQELSGRRKRVLDKPFPPDADQLKKEKAAIKTEKDDKPSVGWRYRYRVSKMLEAKKRGEYVDDEEEKRKARLEQKKKPTSQNKSRHVDSEKRTEEDKDLDPELRKVNAEGRRVGWAYRYRIRRKLDYLKQQQIATGESFDIATLSSKREKNVTKSKTKSKEKKTSEPVEQKADNKTKSVGWEYRYRVSKMREAQKNEKSKVPTTKKQEPIPDQEQLDPELAKLTPEQRAVGWKYRYRIRRKLDSEKNSATPETGSGKRTKKASPSKGKNKKKIIKKVEESIEKILNIDDIDETPFMEYVRRTSSYVFSGLVPTAKKSICLLPLPVTLSFCDEEDTNQIQSKQKSKRRRPKRLKTKKEYRAKQFIRSHSTKLGAEDKATEKRVDETMKKLYKKPSLPPVQTPPTPPGHEKTEKKHHIHPPKEPSNRPKEDPVQKKIGVESKKNKNKKQFQIIGKEIKNKHKNVTSPTTVTTPPPVVEDSKSTTAPPPPPRLRTISEVIQEEAATILAVRRKSSRTPEELQEDINETNESIQEQKKHKATTTTTTTTMSTVRVDSKTSVKGDNDVVSSKDKDSTSKNEKAKENMHDTLGLEKDKN